MPLAGGMTPLLLLLYHLAVGSLAFRTGAGAERFGAPCRPVPYRPRRPERQAACQ